MRQAKNDLVHEVISAVAEAICSAGQQGIPSGHLYAALCGILSLDAYEGIVKSLIEVGLVERTNHLLRWTYKSAVRH